VRDANLGNGNAPDVVLEDRGAAADQATQYWRVVSEPNGGKSLLNKSGGRAAAIWTGNATAGQKIGQWVDNSSTGSWRLFKTSGGYYRLQAVKNTSLYLTGASAGAPLTLQNATDDGSQEWKLVRQALSHRSGQGRVPAPGPDPGRVPARTARRPPVCHPPGTAPDRSPQRASA